VEKRSKGSRSAREGAERTADGGSSDGGCADGRSADGGRADSRSSASGCRGRCAEGDGGRDVNAGGGEEERLRVGLCPAEEKRSQEGATSVRAARPHHGGAFASTVKDAGVERMRWERAVREGRRGYCRG